MENDRTRERFCCHHGERFCYHHGERFLVVEEEALGSFLEEALLEETGSLWDSKSVL